MTNPTTLSATATRVPSPTPDLPPMPPTIWLHCFRFYNRFVWYAGIDEPRDSNIIHNSIHRIDLKPSAPATADRRDEIIRTLLREVGDWRATCGVKGNNRHQEGWFTKPVDGSYAMPRCNATDKLGNLDEWRKP